MAAFAVHPSPDSGNVVSYVNPAFERLSGYSSSDLVGRACSFLPIEAEGMFSAAAADKAWEGTLELRTASGENLYSRLTARLCEEEELVLVFCSRESDGAQESQAESDKHSHPCQLTEEAAPILKEAIQKEVLAWPNIFGCLTVAVSGEILEANDTFLVMSGYTREELEQRKLPCLELPLPRDLVSTEDSYFSDTKTGAAIPPVEMQYTHKQGHPVDILLGATLHPESPEKLLCFALDITERKQAEAALRKVNEELETQFTETFQQAAIGIAHTDMTGRWIQVNGRLSDITGYSREELMRMSFRDITHPDDLPDNQNSMRRLLSNEIKTYRTEKRYVHKQGHIVWVELTVSLCRNLQGEPKYFIAFMEDISRRKAMEAALLESESRFRYIVESNMLGIMYADINNGLIIDANDALLDMIGYSREELLAGQISWAKLTPIDQFQQEGEKIAETFEKGICRPFEKQYIHKDGQRIDIIIGAALLEGSKTQVVCYVLDITRKKQFEKALQESEIK